MPRNMRIGPVCNVWSDDGVSRRTDETSSCENIYRTHVVHLLFLCRHFSYTSISFVLLFIFFLCLLPPFLLFHFLLFFLSFFFSFFVLCLVSYFFFFFFLSFFFSYRFLLLFLPLFDLLFIFLLLLFFSFSSPFPSSPWSPYSPAASKALKRVR